jgi:hypothetical protein
LNAPFGAFFYDYFATKSHFISLFCLNLTVNLSWMKRIKIIIASTVIFLAILLIIFVHDRCKQDELIYSKIEPVCFKRDIHPIFINNCGVIGCHDRPSASAGYVFVDYNSILKKGLTPFNPCKSIVYKSIIGEGASLMPPGIDLKENEKLLIRVWIGQGAENSNCSADISPLENKSRLNVNN